MVVSVYQDSCVYSRMGSIRMYDATSAMNITDPAAFASLQQLSSDPYCPFHQPLRLLQRESHRDKTAHELAFFQDSCPKRYDTFIGDRFRIQMTARKYQIMRRSSFDLHRISYSEQTNILRPPTARTGHGPVAATTDPHLHRLPAS